MQYEMNQNSQIVIGKTISFIFSAFDIIMFIIIMIVGVVVFLKFSCSI